MTQDAREREMETMGDAPGDPGIGVLLVNLGSPDAPTREAVGRYLKEFLWDPRLIDMPRPLWWLILNGMILRTRPARSARLYAEIWTDEGAPLIVITRRQAEATEALLAELTGIDMPVAVGMRYGNPSIRAGLESLRDRNCGRILVVPLYPQYSSSTTASVFDALGSVFKGWRRLPEMRMVHDYHDDPEYIGALAASIRESWEANGEPDRLLVSFHGIPLRYAETGDPYPEQCRTTAHLLAEHLSLADDQWGMAFQSRFGREEWVRPYTDETLRQYAESGVGRVDVVCPGFAADCLETLEEIAVTNKALFLTAGGKQYHYIPALNDRGDAVSMIVSVLRRNLRGWL